MSSDFQLTNRLKKEFSQLDDARHRRASGLFVAEGTKCVLELAAAFTPRYVFADAEWIAANGGVLAGCPVVESRRQTLRELTRLGTTPPVIAYFELPEPAGLPTGETLASQLIVALDRVQDPGNLGTILRTCDWMGVHTVVATTDTVDAFNPKTVQATMGALARVRVVYTDLAAFIADAGDTVPIYGTFLHGTDIYHTTLTSNGIIVMGNEGRGISPEVARHVNRALYIPPYPADAAAVESLNVAIATAIILSQFRGR